MLRRREIDALRSTGADFGTIDSLLSMKNDRGESLFKPSVVEWFLQSGGTVRYAEKLAGVRYRYERRLQGYQIAKLHALDVTTKEVEFYAGLDSTLFSGPELLHYIEAGGDTLYAGQMYHLFRQHEYHLRGMILLKLVENRITADQIEPFLEIKMNAPFYLIDYILEGGTVEYAKACAEKTRSFEDVLRYYRWKVPVENLREFADTDRPNSLFLFAVSDFNGEFTSDAAVKLYNEIWKAYDTRVEIIHNEMQIKQLIEETGTIDLLAICGHGSSESLTLDSRKEIISNLNYYEKMDIDPTDVELEEAFSLMPDDGVIFLDACETRKPTQSGRNLFRFIESIAGGRRVIGAETVFTHDQIILRQAYPLEIEFREPTQKAEDLSPSAPSLQPDRK